MTTNESLKGEQGTPQPQDAKATRERSTIVFPYQDLGDAIAVAKGVQAAGGTSCGLDALAAGLGHTNTTSGTFQLRLNTARIFGLLTSSKGTVTLTPLGAQIVDPRQEKAAKVESFLYVPLYKKIYEQFKGTSLPPASGLEATIGSLGVAPKQKDTARRTLQRSAELAGFFAYGKDRLVAPAVKGVLDATSNTEEDAGHREEKPSGNGNDGDGPRQPPIQWLIELLPDIGAEWAVEDRRKWLLAAASNFDVAYKNSADSKGSSIKVSIVRDEDSAK